MVEMHIVHCGLRFNYKFVQFYACLTVKIIQLNDLNHSNAPSRFITAGTKCELTSASIHRLSETQ